MTTHLQEDKLAQRSLEVLRAGQAPSGALIASPSFDVYKFSWLRDGSFCAHALDAAGDHDAARAFHRWVARSVEAHRGLFETTLAALRAGTVPPAEAMPPTRYTLDGELEPEGDEAWPNFQLDGYGMWLWALAAHLDGAPAPDDLRPAVRLVADYLREAWGLRCFDCWEEFGGGEHASTLGAVAAGFDGAVRLLDEPGWQIDADRVRSELMERFTVGGRFKRGAQDERVDGSLLWLAVPFGVLGPDHPVIRATVDAVRRDLSGPGGGIYRYRGDTYFGGGQWLLLTSSLAWHDAVAGNTAAAIAAQDWVRAQATADGDLPEQVTGCAQTPEMIAEWVERWGPVATPLLWSHAMYLLAERALT